MRKLILLCLLTFLWNCSTVKFKKTYKNPIPPTFKIAALSATTEKQIKKDTALERHVIEEEVFEESVASYLEELKIKKSRYWVLPLEQNQKLLAALNEAENSDKKLIKITFPKSKSANDFEFTTTDDFCEFGDRVSIYHCDLFKNILNDSNIKRFVITKGKERIDASELRQRSNCETQDGHYIEALFAVELKQPDKNGNRYVYYNLSHIPPGKNK